MTSRSDAPEREPPTCYRCGRGLDPERFDLDGWIVLDAREDGWMVVACPDCQTKAERVIVSTIPRAGSPPQP